MLSRVVEDSAFIAHLLLLKPSIFPWKREYGDKLRLGLSEV